MGPMEQLWYQMTGEEQFQAENNDCSVSGHVRSVSSKGPRFDCLRCDGTFDRDPLSEDIFIMPRKADAISG